MKTAVILSGRVTGEGQVELDERIPLPAGPVRVTLEPLDLPVPPPSFQWPSEEELAARKAKLLELAGTISDEEAQRMLKVIEEEFGQVDPDEWR